jgi:peptide-methionine (S)-S-oxide reductase
VESDLEKLPGVSAVISGYTGGKIANPGYEQVSAGGTGHAESVEVRYDASVIGYEKLLDAFWHSIDPTVKDQQFCDRGSQYRSAIFYKGEEQKKLAEASKARIEQQLKTTVYTEIVAASAFYPAEEYHQDYYKKNPLRYKYYRHGCGRDERVKQIWGSSAAH